MTFSITLAIALAFAALMPFFAVHNPSSGKAETHLSSLLGEKILICSGDGFKWVKLADLQSGKEKPAPHSGDKCPLCFAAQHNAAIAETPSLATTLPEFAAASVYYEPSLVPLLQLSPFSSRAPPYSFIG